MTPAPASIHEVSSPAAAYTRRRDAFSGEIRELNQRHILLGYLRVALFVLLVVLGWKAGTIGGGYFPGLLAGVLVFAGLSLFHQRVMRAGRKAKRALAFYERGLARLEDRWAGSGDSGEQFRDPAHVYAEDLDILGDGSLFQLLSLARTPMGEEVLADWLLSPANLQTALQRQAAVRELKDKFDFRESLAVAGDTGKLKCDARRLRQWAALETGEPENRCLDAGEGDTKEIDAKVLDPGDPQARASGVIANQSLWWWVVSAMTMLTTASLVNIVSAGLNTRSSLPLALLLLGNTLIRYKLRHQTAAPLGEATRDLNALADILDRIERERFEAPLLLELQKRLLSGRRPASKSIRRLSVFGDLQEDGRNMVVRILDSLVLYSLHVTFFLQFWRKRYGKSLASWFQAVGEIETLVSMGAYAFEHPADPCPEFVSPEDPTCFSGDSLGHPLLPDQMCVRNSVALDRALPAWIVSGSNMSGKSTLLRVVGINAVLAMMGAPVRARRLRLSPLRLGTSMRLSDSLRKGVSHFYAEITRLRDVVALSKDGPLLFLFDEILQGTNSQDRHTGTEGVLRGLLARQAIGLVTTHDLKLTSLTEAFPNQIRNVHFQEKLESGKLSFDYQLRPGVVTSSNGVELMRSIGLDV